MPENSSGNNTEKPDVELLVRQIQAGRNIDRNFRALCKLYLPSIYSFLLSRGYQMEDVDDLSQEVFVRVYTKVESYRFDAPFENWIMRTLANTWKNDLRKRKAGKRKAPEVPMDDIIEQRLEGQMQTSSSRTPEPIDHVLAQERTVVLKEALEQLPPRMRECVQFRLNQDLTYKEIAMVMGISEPAVKEQMQKARRRLKPKLQRHFDAIQL